MEEPNPGGLCQCGCGQLAPISPQNDTKRGVVRGKPVRFVRGHVGRTKTRIPDERDWTITDCDYATPCWIWNKEKRAGGYGVIWHSGKRSLAHRFMYELHVGRIPDGLQLDHLCRNPSCVRPDHLEPVTAAVNQQRGATTRLTADDVLAIRDDQRSCQMIAIEYGVTRSNVSAIKRRDSWKNI